MSERWQSHRSGAAAAGESIDITPTEPLFIERGNAISHAVEEAEA